MYSFFPNSEVANTAKKQVAQLFGAIQYIMHRSYQYKTCNNSTYNTK